MTAGDVSHGISLTSSRGGLLMSAICEVGLLTSVASVAPAADAASDALS